MEHSRGPPVSAPCGTLDKPDTVLVERGKRERRYAAAALLKLLRSGRASHVGEDFCSDE
jgi:hypothetical protein